LREVTIQDQDPLKLIPHGDRLLVEVVAVNETTDSGITLVREGNKGTEVDLGWCAGVVINVGNGHRLDVPDQAVAISTEIKTDDKGAPVDVHPFLVLADTATNSAVAMVPSTVPMPFARGMVVMCAKYAGSDIKLRGKQYKIITQAHVIGVFTGVKMAVGDTPKIESASIPCANPEPDMSIAVDAAVARMNSNPLGAAPFH
jgi:co-chaperonin GroES (HSP10)